MKISCILLTIVCAIFIWAESMAKTIEVCPSCKLASVQAGLLASSDFDTLVIQHGTYREFDLKVLHPLTIIGIDYPTIDGENRGEIITIQSDNVTIDGLHIINVGTSYTIDYAAIRVVKSRNFEIRNVHLERLFFGIYLEKSNWGRIHHNRIHGQATEEYNSGNGIHLWYSHGIEISENDIRGVRDGIYLEFADSAIIEHNYSRDNVRYGLHFMFSNDDLYTENTFERNGAGVAVMFSKRIRMIRNTFRNNWGGASYGLLLKEIYDADIEENIFDNNTIGINVEGSSRINYRTNDFINNGWAIKISGGCYDNHINGNNFIANSFDLAMNETANNNNIERNFWADYSGYDLDRDGFGDVPHRPVKLFNFIVLKTPESVILLRSLLIDIINFSEKVSPILTPKNVLDISPVMKRINHKS